MELQPDLKAHEFAEKKSSYLCVVKRRQYAESLVAAGVPA
jgi:hypothetical protein